MKFKIVVQPEAKKDIDLALNYYRDVTNSAIAKKLNLEIQLAFSALKTNPFYQIRTKNYRAIPLKKFPYLLFYQILEPQRTIFIIALFNILLEGNLRTKVARLYFLKQ
jgi:addiction module RelE/StbE family toxin